jgi:ribosomal protein L17
MATVTLTLDEYEALRSLIGSERESEGAVEEAKMPKPKRKPSAYNRAYSKAFKKMAPRFKKKNGGWMKDGFKRTAAAARKSIK